jgi:hypothetical protein
MMMDTTGTRFSFIKALTEAVDYVKTDLMPDFDFDAFNHENDGEGEYEQHTVTEVREEVVETRVETPVENPVETPPAAGSTEEVDKW